MAIKLRKIKKLGGSKFLLTSALFLIVILLGFLVAWAYQGSQFETGIPAAPLNPHAEQDKTEKHKKNSGCSYGNVPVTPYLNTYTVKEGETFQTIAQNEFGDISRYAELYNINRDKYPDLYGYDQPLLTGLKLYLPPKAWGINSGRLSAKAGEILEIVGSSFYLDVSSNLDYVNRSRYPYDNRTIFVDKKEFEKGDCVTIVVSDEGSYEYRIIRISPQ